MSHEGFEPREERFEERIRAAVSRRSRERGGLSAGFGVSVVTRLHLVEALGRSRRWRWTRWAGAAVGASAATVVAYVKAPSAEVILEVWPAHAAGLLAEMLSSSASTDLAAGVLALVTVAVLLAFGVEPTPDDAF